MKTRCHHCGLWLDHVQVPWPVACSSFTCIDQVTKSLLHHLAQVGATTPRNIYRSQEDKVRMYGTLYGSRIEDLDPRDVKIAVNELKERINRGARREEESTQA